MNDRLKFDIVFEDDPDRGIAATLEESVSWGWFRIVVDGVNLCQHIANSEVSDRVHWYLLPMIEWFIDNWDSLLHETKLPPLFLDAVSARQGFRSFNPYRNVADHERGASSIEDDETGVYEWVQRHALRSSADGGIFPDVFLRRSRNEIEVSWGHTRVQGGPGDLRFLAPASQALLNARATANCLYVAIEQALNQLRQKVPGSIRLLVLSNKLAGLNEPKSLERAAWMAGIGASVQESETFLKKLLDGIEQTYSDLIAPVQEKLVISRAPAAILMFGSLSPSVSEQDVGALLGLLEDATGRDIGEPGLPNITHEGESINPWEQGYALANLSREALGVPEKPYRVSLDELLSRTGIAKREVTLSDTKVRAIAICGKELRPLIAVNKSCKHNDAEPGLRFTLAHELCHLLFDKEEGVPLAVASGPWAVATIEKRANAFAAMFLMPADACRSLLSKYRQDGKLGPNVISEISSAFGTGKLATLRHLSNLGLIEHDEVSLIEEEFVN